MTRGQWESLTDEERARTHADHVFRGEPLKDYDDEMRRVEQIRTRAENLGLIERGRNISSLELEELLSRHAAETAATVLLRENRLRELKKDKNTLNEIIEDKIKYTDLIKETVKNKMLNRDYDDEFWQSVEAMKYLTPGEQYLVGETMSNRDYCTELNKFLRNNVSKNIINSKGLDIQKVRSNIINSLDDIGKTSYKRLYRGVRNPNNVVNINKNTENLQIIVERIIKEGNAKNNIIEFGGSNYPWSSGRHVAEMYAKDPKGVVFSIRTKKGIPGMSLSKQMDEKEYTVTMGMRARVVKVKEVRGRDYKYLVELEEIKDGEKVKPNIKLICPESVSFPQQLVPPS
jgi:hypothetical protein